MFSKKEIAELIKRVDELSEKIDKIYNTQNSQFTDIVMHLKETRDEIKDKNDHQKLLIDGDEEGVDDSLYEDAKKLVIKTGQVSTSFIQRKFGIGYSRAAHLIDTLEEQGVIGPKNGSKPREIIINEDSGSVVHG